MINKETPYTGDYCNLNCKHSKPTKAEMTGDCHTIVALHCKLKKKLVLKNIKCDDYEPRKKDY